MLTESIWIIGTDLNPSAGGPYKTTQMFRKALHGEILSMSQSVLPSENPRKDGTHLIRTRGALLPTSKTIFQANELTENAALLSSHMLFRFSQIYCYLRARSRKIPYWVVPHGSMDPWVFSYGRMQKTIWYQCFGKSYFKNSTHVIVATEKEKQKMASRYSGANVRVIPWPTEQKDFASKPKYSAQFRQKLGIPKNSRMLISFGRYHSMKRPKETITAFIEADTRNTHLVLAGIEDNITRRELLDASKGLNNIHILGSVFGIEKEELLFAADGYISLSIRENFNHTLAESMASGAVPIISDGNDLGYMLPVTLRRWLLGRDTLAEAIVAIKEFDNAKQSEISETGKMAKTWTEEHLSYSKFEYSLRKLATEAMRCTPIYF